VVDDERFRMPSDESPFNTIGRDGANAPASLGGAPAASSACICRRCGAQFTPRMWDRLKPAIGFLAVVAFILLKHLAQTGSRYSTPQAFSPSLLLAIGGGAIGIALVIYWKGRRCPACKAWDVVAIDSPAGCLVLEHPPTYDASKYDRQGRRRYTGRRAYLTAGVALLFILALLVCLVALRR
jgi:hypothetical protein